MARLAEIVLVVAAIGLAALIVTALVATGWHDIFVVVIPVFAGAGLVWWAVNTVVKDRLG